MKKSLLTCILIGIATLGHAEDKDPMPPEHKYTPGEIALEIGAIGALTALVYQGGKSDPEGMRNLYSFLSVAYGGLAHPTVETRGMLLGLISTALINQYYTSNPPENRSQAGMANLATLYGVPAAYIFLKKKNNKDRDAANMIIPYFNDHQVGLIYASMF